MTNKLDIFEILERIDNFDISFFLNLTEEEKKGISPYLIMMWMAGCKSEIQIRQLNLFLNSFIFNLPTNHTSLLFKLACISSDGVQKKYLWVKKPSNKKYPTSVAVLKACYNCSSKIAEEYINQVDCDFVIEKAIELGEQDKILNSIRKEFGLPKK